MKNLSIKNSISHYIICQLYTCTHNLTQKKKKNWALCLSHSTIQKLADSLLRILILNLIPLTGRD